MREKREQKKHVLMVSCEGLGRGGVQNVMMNIIRNLSKEYSFDLLLFTNERRAYDDEAEKYCKIHRIPNKKNKLDFYVRFPRILMHTYALLRSQKYDIIHCNNGYESGICLFAAKLANIKKRIAHSHTILDITKSNFFAKILCRFYKFLINRYSTQRIACSEMAGRSIYNKSFYTIVNSIDLQRFNISRRKTKPHDCVNFVHIGRFSEQKNQIFVIEIISYLRKQIPNIKLTFIGWGDEYREKMNIEIKKRELENIVKFFPPDTDVEEILAESDYMIFPSKSEGLGIALLEAQAMGVYCFVSTGIPREADAGLCTFIELDSGYKKWSSRITYFIKKRKKERYASKIYEYSIDTFCLKIKKIYN